MSPIGLASLVSPFSIQHNPNGPYENRHIHVHVVVPDIFNVEGDSLLIVQIVTSGYLPQSRHTGLNAQKLRCILSVAL